MESKHTPTPWKLETNYAWNEGTKDRGSIFSCNMKVGTHIPDDQNMVNAAFIVRAVNAHEELIAFIKACLDAKSETELLDFVQNNAEEIVAKAEGK